MNLIKISSGVVVSDCILTRTPYPNKEFIMGVKVFIPNINHDSHSLLFLVLDESLTRLRGVDNKEGSVSSHVKLHYNVRWIDKRSSLSEEENEKEN